MTDHIAETSTAIDATPIEVWAVLTDLERAPDYMLGARIETDWRPGSSIVWSGKMQGKDFRDHGIVLDAEPGRLLRVTHFSPSSGQEDRPENYHTVSFELEPHGTGTRLTLTQDNNPTIDAMQHSEANWRTVAEALKLAVESGGTRRGDAKRA